MHTTMHNNYVAMNPFCCVFCCFSTFQKKKYITFSQNKSLSGWVRLLSDRALKLVCFIRWYGPAIYTKLFTCVRCLTVCVFFRTWFCFLYILIDSTVSYNEWFAAVRCVLIICKSKQKKMGKVQKDQHGQLIKKRAVDLFVNNKFIVCYARRNSWKKMMTPNNLVTWSLEPLDTWKKRKKRETLRVVLGTGTFPKQITSSPLIVFINCLVQQLFIDDLVVALPA